MKKELITALAKKRINVVEILTLDGVTKIEVIRHNSRYYYNGLTARETKDFYISIMSLNDYIDYLDLK